MSDNKKLAAVFVASLVAAFVWVLVVPPTLYPQQINATWTVKKIADNQNVCIVDRRKLNAFLSTREDQYEIISIAPADFLCYNYIVVEKELGK